jgi:predicted PurR-regulated permease PerM
MTDRSSKHPATPPGDAFARRAAVASVVFVAVCFVALFLWYSVYVLFLLFGGVLVAILLRALAELVHRFTKFSHRVSLLVVLVALAGAAVGLWLLVVPSLGRQFAQLGDQLPQAWRNFENKIHDTALGRVVLDNAGPASSQPTTAAAAPASQPAVAETSVVPRPPGATGTGDLGTLLGRYGGFLSTALDVVAAILVVLFTGIFLAFDPTMYVRGAIHLVPSGFRVRFGEVLGAIGYTLKWWLVGQGITMLVIATATAIGLKLLGVPLALVLGVIAGLFNFIPNFGPLFSMVPATLLALTISPERAAGVIVMFIVLQNLEGNVLTPLIQRKAVDLPPALGIIAQILLGILVGPVGLILAWPLCAVVVMAVKMLYVEDVLGDDLRTPDDQVSEEVRDAKREARAVERGD